MLPTNTHKYLEISLYILQTEICFGQPCDHLQGCKIQRLATLEV
jgi:hypothetical protein